MENVSTITQVAETISNLGVTIVCSAILLIFCVIMFKNQQKMIDNLQNLVIKMGSTPASKEHPDVEDIEMLDIVNNKIHVELSLLLQSVGCDRAYIYLYHNGGVSSSGLFFQRMSCISEVVSPGILPVSDISQQLHRSSYSRMLNIVQDEGQWFVEDTGSLLESDGFLFQRFKSTHTESAYMSGLRSSQGHVIGFVGVDYCSLNYDQEKDFILKELKKTSSVLSTLVDIRGEVGGSVEEDSK